MDRDSDEHDVIGLGFGSLLWLVPFGQSVSHYGYDYLAQHFFYDVRTRVGVYICQAHESSLSFY